MNYLENFDIESAGSDPVEVVHELFNYVNDQMGAETSAPLPQDVVDVVMDYLIPVNEDYGLLVAMEQNERYDND